MPKTKTLDQIEAMRQKAVRFLENVVGDPDRAEEFASMSPEEYAAHKKLQIANPRLRPSQIQKGEAPMAKMTRADLEARLDELEEENQALNEKLDSILDIAEGNDDDSEGSDFDDGDEE